MRKKRILIVLFTLVLFGCSKSDNTTCYVCEVTGSILGPQYDKQVEQCVEREEDLDMDWQDPSGNDMSISCRLK